MDAGDVRWLFVSLTSGDPIQIVTFEPPEAVDYQLVELPPLPMLAAAVLVLLAQLLALALGR